MKKLICLFCNLNKYLIRTKRNGDIDMNEKSEMIFMQVRLLRLASEKWHMSIQKVNILFEKYGVFKFIEDCYGIFHTEGDYAVFNEIETLLKNKGEDVNARII